MSINNKPLNAQASLKYPNKEGLKISKWTMSTLTMKARDSQASLVFDLWKPINEQADRWYLNNEGSGMHRPIFSIQKMKACKGVGGPGVF